MGLSVVPAASTFAEDMSRGQVVVESDVAGPPFQAAFDELQSPEARTLAIRYAVSKGMSSPRLNGANSSTFPVNDQFTPLEQVRGDDGKQPPLTDPRMKPHRYRVRVPLLAAL